MRLLLYLLLFIQIGFLENGLLAQNEMDSLNLKGKELFHKGRLVGVVDAVFVKKIVSHDGMYAQMEYTFFVEYPDSIPKKHVQIAANALLPYGSSVKVLKGKHSGFSNETIKLSNAGDFLKSSGNKRIAGVITAVGGAGIALGMTALNQPVVGGVLGGISGLIALILELWSSADLIHAGKELEKANIKP